MISNGKIKGLVERHVVAYNAVRGVRASLLVPKRARVINNTVDGQNAGYTKGELHVDRGHAYSHLRSLPERTVFRPEPITINGISYYAELKGYGINGKCLYPTFHSEGDLFYGMFLRTAQEEYAQLVENLNCKHVPKAGALLSFSSHEFIRQALRGIAELRDGRKRLFKRSIDSVYRQTKMQDAKRYITCWRNKGLDKALQLVLDDSQTDDELRGRSIRRVVEDFRKLPLPAGYLVRFARAPFRLGIAEDLGISETDARDAANSAGAAYGHLITKGMLHLVPGLGNITIAGELTDFEDVALVQNVDKIRSSWFFMRTNYARDGCPDSNFRDYIVWTLGFTHQYLQAFIQETKLGTTPKQVANSIIDQHRGALDDLVRNGLKQNALLVV